MKRVQAKKSVPSVIPVKSGQRKKGATETDADASIKIRMGVNSPKKTTAEPVEAAVPVNPSIAEAKPQKVRAKKRAQNTTPAAVEDTPVPAVVSEISIFARWGRAFPEIGFTERHARIVYYAGVTNVLIGLCFGISALSLLHVENLERLALGSAVSSVRHEAATANYDTSISTLSTGFNPTTNTTQISSGDQNGTTNTNTAGTVGTSSSAPTGTDTGSANTVSDNGTYTTTTQGSSDSDQSETVSDITGTTPSSTTATPAIDTNTGTVPQTDVTTPPLNVPVAVAPEILVSLEGTDPFKDVVVVRIKVPFAQAVEILLRPKDSLTPRHVGTARSVSSEEWRYEWNTRHTPNGNYELFARTKNAYGQYESAPKKVRVENITTATAPLIVSPVSDTSALENKVGEIHKEADAARPIPDLTRSIETAITPQVSELEAGASIEDLSTALAPATAPAKNPEMAIEFDVFESRMKILLDRLELAARADDKEAVGYIKDQIALLKENTLTDMDRRSLIAPADREVVGSTVEQTVAESIERIVEREAIVRERVGELVYVDTDKDGITDYDELRLYKTDPAVADSDNDGFSDGAEIMSGFDPKDDDPESALVFEDPKEHGPVRDDILKVTDIGTEAPQAEEAASAPKAVFRGTALPNSFVTLYIFSEPIVVTVRTEADGSFEYTFDKELENGEHTVIVGMTDNAGRIIAKSQPFPFVKTAEAYAAGAAAGAFVSPQASTEPELFSRGILLLLSALIVMLMGLALVALGAFASRRFDDSVGVRAVSPV